MLQKLNRFTETHGCSSVAFGSETCSAFLNASAPYFEQPDLNQRCCHTLERCSTPTLHYLSTACAHDHQDNWTRFPTEVLFLFMICTQSAAFTHPLSEMFPSRIGVRPGVSVGDCFIYFQIVMVSPAGISLISPCIAYYEHFNLVCAMIASLFVLFFFVGIIVFFVHS